VARKEEHQKGTEHDWIDGQENIRDETGD